MFNRLSFELTLHILHEKLEGKYQVEGFSWGFLGKRPGYPRVTDWDFIFSYLDVHKVGATIFRVFRRISQGVNNLWIKLRFFESFFSLVTCLNPLKCAKRRR